MPDNRTKNREKLQLLLRKLFQFDHADLEFGIYRIMNEKRAEVERFIEYDLLNVVDEALARFKEADHDHLLETVKERHQAVTDALGSDVIDASGQPVDYYDVPVVQRYSEALSDLEQAEVAAETETRVFNDLYRFFSRYYDQGDFLTERRYSSREAKYCVPYNGEEVILHWANRDQYYAKTSERFTDYRFNTGLYTISFRLEQAQVPQDNVRGDSRYFVLHKEHPMTYDAEVRALIVSFVYRPLSEEEVVRYLDMYNAQQSKNSHRKTLDRSVLCTALETEILERIDRADLKATLVAIPKDKENSTLGLHLNRYTARHTMDYFVHKDLGSFLRRELDVFLKTEVLHLGDFVSEESGEIAQNVLTRMRVVRQISHRTIDFLAQIEDFQKRLFEKRKFVVQTDYCITLDQIPEDFYPQILANKAQLDAWRDLYAINEWPDDLFWKGSFDETFLDHHPYIMIDTAFFDLDFKTRLLTIFENLDNTIDGTLIHGENLQTLNLLTTKWQGKIKCIHIDPPYNTQTSGFLYKNNYKHSSWLTMMNDRINLGISLLGNNGDFQCHIDENEQEHLHMLLNTFQLNDLGTVIWDKKNPMLGKKGIATQHEYILWRTRKERAVYMRNTAIKKILSKVTELIEQESEVNEEVRTTFSRWIRDQDDLSGGEKAYRHIDDEGRVFQDVGMGAPEPRTNEKYFKPLIHPKTGKACPVPQNGWSRAPETLQNLKEVGDIYFGEDESKQPRKKVYLTLESNRQRASLLENRLIEEAKGGKSYLDSLGLEFPYSHPVSVYEEMIFSSTEEPGIVLDFFAGSGTSAHAVMNLNREDDGGRKYILIEMGDYFDTVLKPRILKVAFSANWKDGVPQDRDGMSHMIKYQRIESYEDALNNIRLRQPDGEQLELLREFDDYMLHYMLDYETRDSPSMLAQEAFEKPFNYTLKIQRGHESPEDTTVDLIETFHYLIGMHVIRLERHQHQRRTYVVSRGEVRTEHGIEHVVTIWRDTEGLDLEEEADWINTNVLTDLIDRVYVNGYRNFIDHAEPTEITFRQRMEAEVHGT